MKAATVFTEGTDIPLIISIHAAREGGDLPNASSQDPCIKFQSTPPVKAATSNRKEVLRGSEISIHAAREGGDKDALKIGNDNMISIHAAREGGDCYSNHTTDDSNISIHAAREGGDSNS